VKLTVGNKLFLSVLSVSLFIIALIVGLAGWSLRQGFSNYLSQTELNRQEPLVTRLQEIYAARGNWGLFTGSEGSWQNFVESILLQEQQESVPRTPSSTMRPRSESEELERRPPPNAFQECRGKSAGDAVMHDTPEGLVRSTCINSPDGLVARPVRADQPNHRPPETSPAQPYEPLVRRFILLDQRGDPIAGVRLSRSEEILRRPLLHEGKLVGQLGIVVAASSSVIDQAFINHSLNMLLIVAGVALLLSILASLWLAGNMKAILRKITLAARRLASGEYSVRVQSERSDEFGDLVRDFNRLAHALEQHENNRRLWVAQTSHELRTPVSILRAHIEALLDGVRSPGRQEFEVLLKETLRLTKLISDLNDLARADSGALAFQKKPVDFTELIQEMLASFSDRFGKQQIKLSAELSPAVYVFGDASRLSQLCANIFENTLRYTDPGGQLHIALRTQAHAVVLVMEDSSPGVETSVLASLFDPFFRTDQSRHRETGGSGLGLAICKSIVSAHEGTIRAEHSTLGGLKLTITLPELDSKQ